MSQPPCILLGLPVFHGTGRRGCDMGPNAYRAAGIVEALGGLGFKVEDRGDVTPVASRPVTHPNTALKFLPEVSAWITAIDSAAYQVTCHGLPVFMGGDHLLSAGTIPAVSRRAKEEGKPLFVLWLDSHPDYHDLNTTGSGNLHGVPLAYATGQSGFEGVFQPVKTPVEPQNVFAIGLRSVDPAERQHIAAAGLNCFDMRAVDERGVADIVKEVLARVKAADGLLHVSLDVDFLDPDIAPGVGTTVPGGATFREAHLIMELVHDSGLLRAVDLVELNPFLDDRGKTAMLMVDLVSSLLGKRVLDRPTRGK